MKITQVLKSNSFKKLKISLSVSKIAAGFPSPADDYAENQMDLNEFLVPHPAATFFMKVSGDSMTGAGIFSEDMLIVDRSATPKSGNIVVAVLDGEMTVKRLIQKNNEVYLLPENHSYPTIKIANENEFEIWGVVTYVIHRAE